ncbi:MAG: response regulator [Gammaproteobacteria bacterium]|nr:response regulator [Gammaproteobacteria bacterium]
MPTRVLICDDSSFARKQMARALPADWPVEVTLASNGEEALRGVRAGRAEVLFLDLNMPVMDGYQVLEAIRREDLNTLVVVVSGDVQPEAQERVTRLGALAFLRKPVASTDLEPVLDRYGLREGRGGETAPAEVPVDAWDGYREIANVAMGRAADLLARIFGAFILMPIPRVTMLGPADLQAMAEDLYREEALPPVCQGFVGTGIAGEALLAFEEGGIDEVARLMKQEDDRKIDGPAECELLMDLGSVMIGAFLTGLADQLDAVFSQTTPTVLADAARLQDLLRRSTARWTSTLAIEMGFAVEGHRVRGRILLVFDQDSVPRLASVVALACP